MHAFLNWHLSISDSLRLTYLNIYLGSLCFLTEEKWKIETEIENYTSLFYYKYTIYAVPTEQIIKSFCITETTVQWMNFHTLRNSFTFINNLSRLSLLNGDKAEYDNGWPYFGKLFSFNWDILNLVLAVSKVENLNVETCNDFSMLHRCL